LSEFILEVCPTYTDTSA